MGYNFLPCDRNQAYLLPPSLTDWLPAVCTKGSEVRTLTDEQIQHIMDRLNNRPRKSLGYLAPNEVFYGCKKLTG